MWIDMGVVKMWNGMEWNMENVIYLIDMLNKL